MKRFWNKVIKNGPYGCWEWTASTVKGYGRFRLNKKIILAHRFSFELFFKTSPKNKYVLHICDNPICVNPKHLYLGTHQDNMDDKKRRGRGATSYRKGEFHPRSKFSNKDVIRIRKLYSSGKYLQQELAEKFQVQRRAIGRVIDGSRWGHIG